MYLHLGQAVVIPMGDVVGIFDLDNSSWSHRTRAFLERAQAENRVALAGDDLPRSFVLCRDGRVYLSQLSSSALRGRVENGWLES